MSASRHRTEIQDISTQELTMDLEKQRIYLTLHFVTVEFDYMTGMDFADKFRAMVNAIAPVLPLKTTPALHDSGK